MNRRPDLPQVLLSVDLAREPDFGIAGLLVCPSRRQVAALGQQETVQPRVMQVLVALARAKGAVLSREELIESCWDGITVGDDAINRCIAKVRQVAEIGGGKAFKVETIPRVGYRLVGCRSNQAPGEISPPAATAAEALPSHLETAMPEPVVKLWSRVAIVFAVVALMAGAVFAGWWLRPVSPPRWSVAQSEMPIATSLIERHPAISPDGSMIAYSAGRDVLSRHIYLKRISGGDPLELTHDPYDDASPAWSPDGSQIAYVAYKPGEACRLMVVPALAGSPRELARCRSDERSQVVWDVSGKALYFIDRATPNGRDRIMRLEVESGRRTQMTHPPAESGDEEGIAVSPDGQWMAFLRDASQTLAARMLLNLRTGAERVLIPDDYSLASEAWAPDSQSVFTVEEEHGNFSIWSDPIDGHPAQQIFSNTDPLERLGSGPDGLLAVEINRISSGLARISLGGDPNPRIVENENGNAYAPDVAADGSIAVALRRPDGAGIWLLPRNGVLRKLIDLEPDVIESVHPRWSPDGSRLAITWIGDRLEIRIIAATGAVVAKIPFHGRSISAPVWTPDGGSLIFPGENAEGWRLWQVSIDRPSRLVPLTQRGWTFIRDRGSELYGLRSGAPGIWRIDGHPREIVHVSLTDPDLWTVLGDSILYFESGAQVLRSVPLGAGKADTVRPLPNLFRSGGFAADPTSNTIVYATAFDHNAGDIELLHLVRQ
jgi:DNA-binding winged helix-turn-helix (wHTH) protein/dipeptidyl aminopeptidase/acylaminoacyl peptidase